MVIRKKRGYPFSRHFSTLFIALFPSLWFVSQFFWEYFVPKKQLHFSLEDSTHPLSSSWIRVKLLLSWIFLFCIYLSHFWFFWLLFFQTCICNRWLYEHAGPQLQKTEIIPSYWNCNILCFMPFQNLATYLLDSSSSIKIYEEPKPLEV